jgi:hypothetical protein
MGSLTTLHRRLPRKRKKKTTRAAKVLHQFCAAGFLSETRDI